MSHRLTVVKLCKILHGALLYGWPILMEKELDDDDDEILTGKGFLKGFFRCLPHPYNNN